MGMFNVFEIAGQGMAAQTIRLNTTASNIANADTASSNVQDTYKAKHPVFATVQAQIKENMQQDPTSFGVRVLDIKQSNAEPIMKYSPDHPQANDKGYIFLPNVNVVEEMANMISASRTYQTNVQMMNTVKGMMQQTLTIGR
jgi:flagellar basal-body rod protein FlgC